MEYIYTYGITTASTVYQINKNFTYPQPNGYAEIQTIFDSVGGEAVNTAIMLSKFGIKTKLDGNWLNSKKANKIFELLSPFKIDTSRLTIKEDCGTEEIVIADTATRTFFGNFVKFYSGEKQWNKPQESDVEAAAMVTIDPYFKPEAENLARLCEKHNKPYVTIDCTHDSFLAQHAASIIISFELREQAYAGINHETLFHKYLENCNGLVIFTFGSDELWYSRTKNSIHKFKPFKIDPIDTTAAGDSFRAGIVYGLLQNYTDYKTIEFASAVAANVCLSIPHTLNAGGLQDILQFIEHSNSK